MNKAWVLTQESFEALLSWLAPEREDAGRRYEDIRRRLIKIFTCRGCPDAEDLADESINRVAKRLNDIRDSFQGDPFLYFYGVANKVHLESARKKRPPPPPPPKDDPEEIEKTFACLEGCIQNLTASNRELVLQYYHEEKTAKIINRRQLAEQLGIGVNALRIRAHRIRGVLQECVQSCLQEVPV
jgi:DNA-directed RNA polymerase specialized sigma24 family protein